MISREHGVKKNKKSLRETDVIGPNSNGLFSFHFYAVKQYKYCADGATDEYHKKACGPQKYVGWCI